MFFSRFSNTKKVAFILRLLSKFNIQHVNLGVGLSSKVRYISFSEFSFFQTKDGKSDSKNFGVLTICTKEHPTALLQILKLHLMEFLEDFLFLHILIQMEF